MLDPTSSTPRRTGVTVDGLPSRAVTAPVPEVRPDFPREWIELTDPADPEHLVRADLTWLLSSWTCVFGTPACHGTVAGRPDDGCCTHGAFFADAEDRARLDASVADLTAQDWQLRKQGLGRKGYTELDDLEGEPAERTRKVQGACVFLNRPDFPGGPGCALHRMALRTGRHPLETKPDVCWQVPISRREEVAADGRRTTTVTEFSRRSWGEGGADLHWWCTEARSAHVGLVPMYRNYGPELTQLIGAPAYAQLVKLCRKREKGARIELPLIKA